MAFALDPSVDTSIAAARSRVSLQTGTFAIAGLTSIAAGAIHASAMGSHAGIRQAVLTFGLTAAVQVGLGAVALVSRRRIVGAALAAANLAFLGGWVVAKRSGIGFIDGLEGAQSVAWADGLAASLAGATVIAVVAAVAGLRVGRLPKMRVLAPVLALPVAALTLTGMVAAASPSQDRSSDTATAAGADHHATASATGADHHSTATEGGEPAAEPAVVPPTPFVPGQPIDLGGVEGVTAAQQAAAENILAASVLLLPQFADPAVAEARGWFSIGDGGTGEEHFINPATFDDGKILDPSAPESLVYDVVDGERTLAAAMYMLEPGKTLDQVPDVGGNLMQWHIHDNLCFTSTGTVAALREPGGPCPDGLVAGGETPMIHVWIRSNECGPFAALQGIGAGTIKEGETRLCDTAHGH